MARSSGFERQIGRPPDVHGNNECVSLAACRGTTFETSLICEVGLARRVIHGNLEFLDRFRRRGLDPARKGPSRLGM